MEKICGNQLSWPGYAKRGKAYPGFTVNFSFLCIPIKFSFFRNIGLSVLLNLGWEGCNISWTKIFYIAVG